MTNNKLITALLSFLILCSAFTIRQQRNLNIVFIGDSITHGARLKDPANQAPPNHVAELLKQQSGFGNIQFSNQGVSGATTVDFLPSYGDAKLFKKITAAANTFYADKQATLVFNIMLGTNDSAINGPHGSPISPDVYRANLKTIADSLLATYPGCKIVFNHPLWYSPNTHNHSTYLQEGLTRLQTYFPEIDALVKAYKTSHRGQVFLGDKDGFKYFEKNHLTDLDPETGGDGTFYLHPNEKGAVALGNLWAKAIIKALK